MDVEIARFNMVEQQIRPWDVLDTRVLDTCLKVPREFFVPDEYRNLAFSDTTINIGYGQSMMTPKVEARMLQALNIQPDNAVLEIGTGSGYVSALLGTLSQHVISVEIINELAQTAKSKLKAAAIGNVSCHISNGLEGWNDGAPYDVIAVTASSPTRIAELERQLNIGGRIFIFIGVPPVMNATLLTLQDKDNWTEEILFETEVPSLIGAEYKPEFSF